MTQSMDSAALPGNMQSRPINLISILQHAARWHGQQEVVTHAVSGGIHRQTYADTLNRAARLAWSLRKLGLQPGDRVATMGWNTHRHLESWYAISGQGAVCHTINPRLFPEQIEFIVNHAEDRILIVDVSFVATVEKLLQVAPSIESVILMCDQDEMPSCESWPRDAHCYESLVAGGKSSFDWPAIGGDTASSLCYTSGTTGNPKGVLYSHSANLLHAYASCMPDVFDLSAISPILMIVPMFHANSWGIAYAGPLTGAKLVMPGPHMDGASIHRLIVDESITRAAAVPTVWATLLAYLEESGESLGNLKELVVGGAAVASSMITAFERDHGVKVTHAWGMTEMTPIGTVNRPTPATHKLDADAALKLQCKQGRAPYGVDMKIVNDAGIELPRDGVSFGRLFVRGPWTIDRYYKAGASALDGDWFDTGDIATIDTHGFMQITDRAKDLIKSGGEWISSVAIENAALGLQQVQMAACIGARHAKWGERPVLLLVVNEPVSVDRISEHLAESVARWQLPDAVVFVDEIPLTATGKIDKKPLRAAYSNYLLVGDDSGALKT